jgi:hypothetical protein
LTPHITYNIIVGTPRLYGTRVPGVRHTESLEGGR